MQAWDLFYSVFGVIYAIIIGFILAELLTRFYRLMSCIGDELNAVEDVRDFLVYVDENNEVKKDIKVSLFNYLGVVIDQEWDAMKRSCSSFDSDTSSELYRVMESVENIKVIDQSDGVSLSAIIGKNI